VIVGGVLTDGRHLKQRAVEMVKVTKC